MTKYEDIRDSLQDNDVVLFKGKGLASSIISHVCDDSYSHCGFIMIDSGRVMLCESTTFTAGKKEEKPTPYSMQFKGVRLVPFSDVLKYYNGEIVIRRLICKRTETMLEQLRSYVSENLGKRYENNLIELMESADKKIDWYSQSNNSYSTIFCSENLAGAWKLFNWSLLPDWIPSNQYAPYEYAENGLVDKILKDRFDNVWHYEPIRLDNEIRIK